MQTRFSTLALAVAFIMAAGPGPAAARPQARASLETPGDFESARGQKVYRAIRTSEEIVIDGALEEPAWEAAERGAGFYQTDPQSGAPARDDTEFRILYDSDSIYIAMIFHQDGPAIVSEMRREYSPANGDTAAIILDTFNDGRNAFAFEVNPAGAQRDMQIVSGARNSNWEGVWSAATSVHEDRWIAELVFPLRTLRFDDARPVQEWGLQIGRIARYSNERSQWSPAPRPFGTFEVSYFGRLTGIEGVRQGRNFQIKPYATLNHRTDRLLDESDTDADAGFDVKYGLTSGLTLDLTVNTDFSQIEVDEQQVNLTRFSLFFPEKRDFFLENAALFEPGARSGGRDLIPFFSRRIGLSAAGEPLPIRAGARLTGKLGGFDLGAMNIQVGDEGAVPADNWSVLRLKREVLANSSVGGFAFNRRTAGGAYWNRVFGGDFDFRLLRSRLSISGFALESRTPEGLDGNSAAKLDTAYDTTLVSLRGSHTSIGGHFQNDFGFVERGAVRRSAGFAGFRPRPGGGIVQQVYPQVETAYVTDNSNRLLTRQHRAGIQVDFRDGANISLNRNMRFERQESPFRIQGVPIAAGDYGFNNWSASFRTSGAPAVSVNGSFQKGGFWNGTLRQTRFGGSWRQSIHLVAQMDWSRNVVGLEAGRFTTDLVGLRLNLAFTPRMTLENFIQYNAATDAVLSNVRFRLIHSPLSDLFVVYNELRGVDGNRQVARTLGFKFTKLLSF